ncbi:hypothetical protein BSKO_13336 [Bryopsis sp. KO-2023]|nr:hypothetical protein BSKO_13336 [Bryopsis sp. KO-2023]
MSSGGTVEGRRHTHSGDADAPSLFDVWDFEEVALHMNPQEISKPGLTLDFPELEFMECDGTLPGMHGFDGANSTVGDSSSPGSPESSFEQCFPSLDSEFLELDWNAPETPQQCQSMALCPILDDLLMGASADNSSESEFLSPLLDNLFNGASTEKPGGSELLSPFWNNPSIGASAENSSESELLPHFNSPFVGTSAENSSESELLPHFNSPFVGTSAENSSESELLPHFNSPFVGTSAENSSESELLPHFNSPFVGTSAENSSESELLPRFNDPSIGASAENSSESELHSHQLHNPFFGASAENLSESESCTKEDLFSYRQELSAKKLLAALRNWKGPLRGTWPEHDEAMRIGYVVGGFYNMGGGISFSGPPSNAVHPVPGSDGFGVSVCQTLPKVAGNVCERYGPGVRIRKVLWWCSHEIPGGMWEWCEKREQFFNNKIALYLFLEPDDGRLMVLENGRFLKTDDNSIAMKPEDDSGKRKNGSAGGERKIRKVKRTRT